MSFDHTEYAKGIFTHYIALAVPNGEPGEVENAIDSIIEAAVSEAVAKMEARLSTQPAPVAGRSVELANANSDYWKQKYQDAVDMADQAELRADEYLNEATSLRYMLRDILDSLPEDFDGAAVARRYLARLEPQAEQAAEQLMYQPGGVDFLSSMEIANNAQDTQIAAQIFTDKNFQLVEADRNKWRSLLEAVLNELPKGIRSEAVEEARNYFYE